MKEWAMTWCMHGDDHRFLNDCAAIGCCAQHDGERQLLQVDATPLHLAAADIAADMRTNFF